MKRSFRMLICVVVTCVVMTATELSAQEVVDEVPSLADLTDMSLEELMQIEVTSVSKRRVKLVEAAAAVHTLTSEDIRRSGARTIPDALRMVPGMHVAQIDGNKWAVSARGFNDRFSNKLLVLIDGRSVYTPLFSGVYWDTNDVLLEDVERIEVIRGPGATLWGANAVNGVINIITKHSEHTLGAYAVAGGGTVEGGFGAVRFGGKAGKGATYRVYTKYVDRNELAASAGLDAHDSWESFRAGFRLDGEDSGSHSYSFHGDFYDGRSNQVLRLTSLTSPYFQIVEDRAETSGGNAVARWRFDNLSSSQVDVQLYVDYTERTEAFFAEKRRTVDLDFNHSLGLGKSSSLLWGVGARGTRDDVEGSLIASTSEPTRTDHIVSSFIQHDFNAWDHRLRLSTGSKFENNSYSGFEWQPSLRALWAHTSTQSSWFSVSRAVRTPSRAEASSELVFGAFDAGTGTPTVTGIVGTADFESEKLVAWELGHRVQPARYMSLDIATFFNRYTNLRSARSGSPEFRSTSTQPYLFLPLVLTNDAQADIYGLEIATAWHPVQRWKLHVNYTFADESFGVETSGQGTSQNLDVASPQHQMHARSFLTLPWNLEFDSMFNFVGRVDERDLASYARLDVRLGWHPHRYLNVAFGAQNVLDRQHAESTSTFVEVPTEPKRSYYALLSTSY